MTENWLGRLKSGLLKSSERLRGNLSAALAGGRRLDAATLEAVEDALIAADLGPSTAARLAAGLGKGRFDGAVTEAMVRQALAEEIERILAPVALPLRVDPAHAPHVILVTGVNGSGKTTTIGKLAALYRAQGLRVMLAAGDTFRAAAVEQLKIWGERSGSPVIFREGKGNAAGLAYEALEKARAAGVDLLLVDTAGRLHNRQDLMAELGAILRALRKLDADAPHDVLLVLDATIGQNAHVQLAHFLEVAPVNGLVLTKLDGSAKGGVLVALAEKFAIPVRAVGVGEGIGDLRPFSARDYALNLTGLDATLDAGTAAPADAEKN